MTSLIRLSPALKNSRILDLMGLGYRRSLYDSRSDRPAVKFKADPLGPILGLVIFSQSVRLSM